MVATKKQTTGRSRGSALRIKILQDEKSSVAPAAVRRETVPSQPSKFATISATTARVGRAALGDLSNNNRKSEPNPAGLGKEKPRPTSTSVLNQLPQRIVRRIAQAPSNGVTGNAAKPASSRPRPSSMPVTQVTRPGPRAREDDDEEVIGSAKKKMRTGTSSSRPVAPPAPIIEQELENMEISDVPLLRRTLPWSLTHKHGCTTGPGLTPSLRQDSRQSWTLSRRPSKTLLTNGIRPWFPNILMISLQSR
jgi:hypothetical protein